MIPPPDPKESTPSTAAPKHADAAPVDTKKETAPALNQLTPEEQMEKFAEELKEQDWGHQPC